mgnify:CR=1 FL=1
MSDSSPLLSIVAPCYNEEEVLPDFHRRMADACRDMACSYEIILVNDGSTDATWEIMKRLGKNESQLVAVKLSRNHGHQLALSAGLTVSRGDRVLIIDADLQDPPELVKDMMKLMDEGAEVVYGQRRRRHGEPRLRLISISLFYRMIERLSDTAIARDSGDFRLISRRVVRILQTMPEQHRFLRGMIGWIGLEQKALLYDRDERFAGKTKYPFHKLWKLASDAVTAFSVKPLRLASYFGLLSGIGSLLLLLYAVAGYFMEGTIQGWPSMMAAIALLGSMQLFMLGIIGEYLGRLCEQSKGRPLFVIEEVLRDGARCDPSASPQRVGV